MSSRIDNDNVEKILREMETEGNGKEFYINDVRKKYRSTYKSFCDHKSLKKCLSDDNRFNLREGKVSLAINMSNNSNFTTDRRNAENKRHGRFGMNFGYGVVHRRRKRPINNQLRLSPGQFQSSTSSKSRGLVTVPNAKTARKQPTKKKSPFETSERTAKPKLVTELVEKVLREMEKEGNGKEFYIHDVRKKYLSLYKSFCDVRSLKNCLEEDNRFKLEKGKASLSTTNNSGLEIKPQSTRISPRIVVIPSTPSPVKKQQGGKGVPLFRQRKKLKTRSERMKKRASKQVTLTLPQKREKRSPASPGNNQKYSGFGLNLGQFADFSEKRTSSSTTKNTTSSPPRQKNSQSVMERKKFFEKKGMFEVGVVPQRSLDSSTKKKKKKKRNLLVKIPKASKKKEKRVELVVSPGPNTIEKNWEEMIIEHVDRSGRSTDDRYLEPPQPVYYPSFGKKSSSSGFSFPTSPLNDDDSDKLQIAIQTLERVEESFLESLNKYGPLIREHPLIDKIVKVFEEEREITEREFHQENSLTESVKIGKKVNLFVGAAKQTVGSFFKKISKYVSGGEEGASSKTSSSSVNKSFLRKVEAIQDTSRRTRRMSRADIVLENMDFVVDVYKQRGDRIRKLELDREGMDSNIEQNTQAFRHVKSRSLESNRKGETGDGSVSPTRTKTDSQSGTETDTDTLSSVQVGGGGKGTRIKFQDNEEEEEEEGEEERIKHEGVQHCKEFLNSNSILKKSTLIGLFHKDFKKADVSDLVRNGKSKEAKDGLRSHKVFFVLNTQFDIIFMGKRLDVKAFPIDAMFRREMIISMMMNTPKYVKSGVLRRVQDDYGQFFHEVIAPHQPQVQPSDFIVKCHGLKVERFEGNQDSINLWIIMEACDCCIQTLLNTRLDMVEVRKRNPFTLKEKFDMMYQMAISLYVLHKAATGKKVNGIFHSDIKPGNFLVNKTFQNNRSIIRVKLCDFGLSLQFDEATRDVKEAYRGNYSKGWVYVDEMEKCEVPSFERDICALGFCFGTVFFSVDKYVEPFKPLESGRRNMKSPKRGRNHQSNMRVPNMNIKEKRTYSTDKEPFEQQFRKYTTRSIPPEFTELLERMWDRDPSKRCNIDYVLDWFMMNRRQKWFLSTNWKLQ